ncbi:prolyl aminopeptidase [Acidipropionibacterium timonense]|uniref:prolyl aminopeptidase n=1 Tax=Acidipropionibacterium timonense TaxID=2161818 RepID=UPI00103067B1|nr:prolyl aminopeptidase [Acidipropionibacterium timonense]
MTIATPELGITPDRTLYPPIDPYDTRMLDVGDGQMLYVEQCGNPEGKPVIFLHGGPGGGGGTERRRFFDPQAYRIVVIDQRGCGSSTPHIASAKTPDDMASNTTWNLVEDCEKVRRALGIDRWQVFGGSWGSCLALAYAQTHPEVVTELVLRGIFTLRTSELDWYYNEGASFVFPERWDAFCEPLRRAGHDFSEDNISAYYDLLWDPSPAVHGPAAVAWTSWEAATTTLAFEQAHVDEMADPEYALAFARIENHYFVNHGFMTEGQLIRDAAKLAGIPTVIVQGRYDMCCPATTAVDLKRALPSADLRIVMSGHSAFEPLITSELVKVCDGFACR